jgi:hypothetical protein
VSLDLILTFLITVGTAYSNVEEEAVANFMAIFSRSKSRKTTIIESGLTLIFPSEVVSSVRAPDEFVYVAPFTMLELFIVPFESILSRKDYARLNRSVMTVFFFPALWVVLTGIMCINHCITEFSSHIFRFCIAVYESRYATWLRRRLEDALEDNQDDLIEDPDPARDHIECNSSHVANTAEELQGQISKVPFSELTKSFPDLSRSVETNILAEVRRTSLSSLTSFPYGG